MTMPLIFDDDSSGMAVAKQILQYAKDLDIELTAKYTMKETKNED